MRGFRSIAAVGSVAMLVAAIMAPTTLAAAPYPVAGSAVVDGDPSEWTAADHFADMTNNGDPDNEVVGALSLRYDCETGTVYALAVAIPPTRVKQDRADEAYISIDASGKAVQGSTTDNDGMPPDFAWVNGDGTRADGYEASFQLAEGTYTIRAHFLIPADDSDGYQTIDTTPRHSPLILVCEEPTPTPTQATSTPSGSVTPSETPSGSVSPSSSPSETPSGSVSPSSSPSGSTTPSESPDGSVDPATGTPNITLPPTDAVDGGTGTTAGSGLQLVLFGMAALFGALALLTPTRRTRAAAAEEAELD